jgi:tetratricopeptide (TPR) repeat protein
LGNNLRSRYERVGRLEDLEEAIRVTEQAVKVTPNGHPDLLKMLNNLGIELEKRYERIGRIEDLDEAFRVTEQAIKVAPDDHPDLATCLNNLGNQLERRYERIGRIDDLEEAIRVIMQAIKVTPNDHPDLAVRLNNLGNKLEKRYERIRRIEDLEEAIRVTEQAVKVTPKDYLALLAACLNNLGNKLQSRYDHTRRIEDLEEAIRVTEQAVKVTPDDHPDITVYLNNLGTKLKSRYIYTTRREDLEEAIRVTEHAVKVTPDDHPDLTGYLNNLGRMLLFPESSRKPDALKVLLRAWNCSNAIPFLRIQAAVLAIELLHDQGDDNGAYQLSLKAIDLLPRIHNRYLNHHDQQYVVSTFSGLATDACSLAIQVGELPDKAVEILERGRGVILGLLIDDRSDSSELKAAYPDQCALYESLRVEVNTPIDSIVDQGPREIALKRRAKAIEELDGCVNDIRQLPGFGQFQRGLTPKQMLRCSAEGCIVVVNITNIRSDAVIISTDGFKTIPIPDLDASQAKDWIQQGRKNKAYLQFLSWLWRGCVKLVLEELCYTTRPSADELPRIWWIGTGLASSFPFHAAGHYSAGPIEESTYSRVISSYTPTMKALMYARERVSTTTTSHGEPLKLLIVTMPKTPGACDLPGVSIEKSEVETAVGDAISMEILDQPGAQEVINQIGRCNIAHFACHGVSNPDDPSESGLLLQTTKGPALQPEPDLLSVRKVSQLHLTQAKIAYLSACSTAENRMATLVDEVLHLASGFQVAGFRHVVGCLWPSSDKVCVEIAKSFYSKLAQGGAVGYSDRAIALALHKAVVEIRLSDEYRKRPVYWAQYVHFGA